MNKITLTYYDCVVDIDCMKFYKDYTKMIYAENMAYELIGVSAMNNKSVSVKNEYDTINHKRIISVYHNDSLLHKIIIEFIQY